MNTRLNIFVMTSAALLLGLTWTGAAMAQELKPTMPGPEVDRASCDDVEWHRDLLRNYPWVEEACHEAIIIDGQKWARFEAEFVELHRNGEITSNFRDDRGRSLGTVQLMPGTNQRVTLDGRPYRFSELRRGQVLNFYAPDDMYTFTTEPGAPATERVKIVEVPAEDSSTRLTQAEPATTRRPATLPATAGPLPIIALGGLLSLLGGIGLTTRRRFKTPNA